MLEFKHKNSEFNSMVYDLAKQLFSNEFNAHNALDFEHILHDEAPNHNCKNMALSVLEELVMKVKEELYHERKSQFFMDALEQMAQGNTVDGLHDTSFVRFNALINAASKEPKDFYEPFYDYLVSSNKQERIEELKLKANFLSDYNAHLDYSDDYLDVNSYKRLRLPLSDQDLRQIDANRGRHAA
jgi:hypothetical protein